MFDEIVVGLPVSGRTAGAIGVVRAWSPTADARARGLALLIVGPRALTRELGEVALRFRSR